MDECMHVCVCVCAFRWRALDFRFQCYVLAHSFMMEKPQIGLCVFQSLLRTELKNFFFCCLAFSRSFFFSSFPFFFFSIRFCECYNSSGENPDALANNNDLAKKKKKREGKRS